jgi:hypothetical protein
VDSLKLEGARWVANQRPAYQRVDQASSAIASALADRPIAGISSTRPARSSAPKQKAAKPKAEPSIASVPFVTRVVEAPPRHLTLFEFTDELCKYECTGRDDPRPFKFCGNPQVVGSYCAAHARLCFIPKTDSKKLKAAA